MKIRIVIAVILLALIAEFAFLAFKLPEEYAAAVAKAEQEQEEILHRTQQVEQKQDYLNSLKSDKVLDTEEEIERVRQEAASLIEEIKKIQSSEDELLAKLAEMQQYLDENEEQFNYYLEVCNELQKGIETVQGYIAGN